MLCFDTRRVAGLTAEGEALEVEDVAEGGEDIPTVLKAGETVEEVAAVGEALDALRMNFVFVKTLAGVFAATSEGVDDPDIKEAFDTGGAEAFKVGCFTFVVGVLGTLVLEFVPDERVVRVETAFVARDDVAMVAFGATGAIFGDAPAVAASFAETPATDAVLGKAPATAVIFGEAPAPTASLGDIPIDVAFDRIPTVATEEVVDVDETPVDVFLHVLLPPKGEAFGCGGGGGARVSAEECVDLIKEN